MLVATLCLGIAANAASPETTTAPSSLSQWVSGAVLDLGLASERLGLGERPQGLGLGHSDLQFRGPVGRQFLGQIGLAIHSHGNTVESDVEEAWLQSRTLPAGWQLRFGRFLSQISSTNEQHPHLDDFVERPPMYRAMLGGHWFDDGVRLNWTAPSSQLLFRLGAEAFTGRQLVQNTAGTAPSFGAATLSARLGGDVGVSHSWQVGLGYLRNRRDAAVDGDDEQQHDPGSLDHAHGALLSARNLWMAEAVWKWAPQGNNRQQQLKLSAEFAQASDISRSADPDDRHRGGGLAAVWRFAPAWEVGARTDWLRGLLAHEDHFDPLRLREHSVMLAYKPGHFQTWRVQFTSQRSVSGIEKPARQAVFLQYIVNLGAHGAHSY